MGETSGTRFQRSGRNLPPSVPAITPGYTFALPVAAGYVVVGGAIGGWAVPNTTEIRTEGWTQGVVIMWFRSFRGREAPGGCMPEDRMRPGVSTGSIGDRHENPAP